MVGVEFTQQGETYCKYDKREMFTWHTLVVCDTEMDETELVSEEVYEDGCEATVVFRGPAGCPIVDL